MKKSIYFLLFACCYCTVGKAQLMIGMVQGSSTQKNITTSQAVNLTTDDAARSTTNKGVGTNIKILGSRGSDYEIKLSGSKQKYLVAKSDVAADVEGATKKIIPLVGAFSFPFKYRPQSGILETSFSLSMVGGARFTLNEDNKQYFSALLGIGSSSIMLNKDNTALSAGITDNTSRAALTFSLSFLYQWDQLQLACSVGIDNNLDNRKDKWQYQSKPWLTIGLGFDIFKPQE